MTRGELIGALTVQSIHDQAFDESFVAVLQTMCEQLSVSIANARLFDQTSSALPN